MDALHAMNELLGIGVNPKDFSTIQVCARTIVILISALIMIQLAHKRFMAKKTIFEYVIGFVLASVLARAINGSAPLFQSIAGGFVVVAFQWIVAILSFRSRAWGKLVKGTTTKLVENGMLNREAMAHSRVSEADIREDLRLNGGTDDLSQVRLAQMERSGDISILRHPRVIRVKVEQGVQVMELHIDG